MKKINVKLTSITNRKDFPEREHLLIYNAYVLNGALSRPLYVCQSGIKKWRCPGWLSGPAIYDHYIIHCIIDGKGTYYCEDKQYELKAGDLFLIRPYTEVSYRADTQDPYQYYWVGFSGTECIELLMRSGFSENNLVIHADDIEKLISLFSCISDVRSDTRADQYCLVGYLYQVFSMLIRSEERPDRGSSRYYYDAAAYIRQNALRPELTVAEVAEYIGIDRSHLYRIFQENGNNSVKDFITNVRLEKAKLMLSKTEQTIEFISYFAGFSNASHFAQIFRKHVGFSPLQYRQKTKQQGSVMIK